MTQIVVDGMGFSFPDHWAVGKYDDWIFYRKHFSRIKNEIKAVDIVAVDPGKTAWLIEVKDYRRPGVIVPEQLPLQVAEKVLYTLAAILPAKINAIEPLEKGLAQKVSMATSLRIVLQVELPVGSKLFPQDSLRANLKQKLKSIVKPIDPHPMVVSAKNMESVPWCIL